MEISDEHITRLRRCPWLRGAHSDSNSGFYMKFLADADKEECYFMITDTVKVWAETVQGRHISHRTPLPPYPRTEKQERKFIREMLTLIHAAHQLCRIADMDIVAEEGAKCADLLLTVTTPTLHWQWRTFALHPSHSAQILSSHLIQPMLTHMSVFSSFGGHFDLEALTKQLDKTSKTARVTMHTHMKAVFSKPVVACGIARICQSWEKVDDEYLHPMVEELEDLEACTAPLYFPEPISDDEDELEPGPEPYYHSDGLRSSPAPLPADADGSGTEDEDDEDDGAGETQLESAVGVGSRVGTSQASKYGQSQVTTNGQSQANGGHSQATANGLRSQHGHQGSKYGQSQSSKSRPPIHPARSQPHPSRSSAQLSMMSVAGGRSTSQPQVAGQKRPAGASDSEDEYERAEELLRRMNGASRSGAIGMKKTTGRRKF